MSNVEVAEVVDCVQISGIFLKDETHPLVKPVVSNGIFNDIKKLPLLLYNFKAKVTMEEVFKNIINNTNATFFI